MAWMEEEEAAWMEEAFMTLRCECIVGAAMHWWWWRPTLAASAICMPQHAKLDRSKSLTCCGTCCGQPKKLVPAR